jgi:hypothetical protein
MSGDHNGHSGNLIDETLFRILLRLETQKAARLQYCVSVVCLMPDLPSDHFDPSLPRKIAETAIRHLRGTDVATTLSESSVALLLIDADTQTLRQIIDRAAGAFGVTAEGVAAPGQRVSLSAGASCYPETATSGRDLLRQARDLMARARAEGGDRLYLPL